MTPQERLAMVAGLGTRVRHDSRYEGTPGEGRHRIELLDIITGVYLPLTPQEWCDVGMRESDQYVGGCCGNTSAIQDRINAAFRDGGWIDSGDFLYVGWLARNHEGFEGFQTLDDASLRQWVGAWDVYDPWDKLGVVYNGVEALLKPEGLELLPRAERDDVQTLADGLDGMRWETLFQNQPEGLQQQHNANALVTRAKILDPCRRVLAQLEANDERFEGFALIRQGTDEVLANGGGSCIYATHDEAQRWLDLMNRHDAMEDEKEEMYQRPLEVKADIVPCTVTIADGLKIHR